MDRVFGDEGIQIQIIQGEDYEDLQRKLEEYIQSFLALLDKTKREVCPDCKGTGIREHEIV